MSEPLQVSNALLRTLANKPPMSRTDVALMQGYLSGAMPTKPATPRALPPHPLDRFVRSLKLLHGRKWQRSPDRKASMERKRKLGGSSGLPDTIRHLYTEGERAVLAVISGEVKHHGICDLPIDRIAACAGVSRTTVQNAIRQASIHGHVTVQARPRKGQKNLTNLVRIVSPEWLMWLKRGPSPTRSTGFKSFHPTKNQDNKKQDTEKNGNTIRDNRASRDTALGLGAGERRSAGVPTHHGGRCNG